MAGIYEGEATYGQIREYGDFGLGTFNDLDGEMVGFDGTFYQLRSDGSARPVTGDQKTPFAVVTFFQPEQELNVVQQMTKSDLIAAIEKATDANLFSAVRVDGIFDEVRTRTVPRQAKPFPPLTEAAKHQAEKVFTNVEGTLAGFRFTPWLPAKGRRRTLHPEGIVLEGVSEAGSTGPSLNSVLSPYVIRSTK